MPEVEHNTRISSWQEGDHVQGFAFLAKKERRQDRNGKDYLDLELADDTGSMVGKVWGGSPAITAEFEAHQFVAFRGSVRSYRDQLQLNVDHCRIATDDDRKYGFDEKLLIPSTREDIDDLQTRLHGVLEKVERPVLRRLVKETLEVHGEALRVHPAAKMMHHAYLGGLLEHTVSMAELAANICSHYRYLDQDLILVGILFHDLGKIHELGAMPANDYTKAGRLVGHVVIGWDLLRERCKAIEDFPEDLQLHLEHLVLSHQGKKEYSAAVEPMTAEALALHFIDDLDSKLAQVIQAREKDEPMQFLKGLGRYFFVSEGLEAAAGPESEETSDSTTDP
ncbi:MAG: HD domain-containing protein [Deltaproteobacteria bacterium]|nr:HD domain-containing protein [Deltaproteobacteria bacterium]